MDKSADFFALFKDRWKLASEAEKEQRENELADLEFEAGAHWDAAVKKDRERDGKPCLTIDLLSAPIKQVTNQQRTARPGIQISAVSAGTDEKKAATWQGIIRRVERLSQAGRAYTWAGQHQVKMGRGVWMLRTIEVGPDGEQDIRIKAIDNQHCVYVDPSTKELDGADKRWAILFEDLTHEEYKRRFGDAEGETLSGKLESGLSFQGLGDSPPEWITAKSCRIAEYYYLEEEKVAGSRKPRKRVRWCLINGAGDVLEKTTIPGEFIPVVQVYGERRNIDGKKDYRGMVRMAKDPSRMEDFCESSLMEAISLAKTAPWIAEWDQIAEFSKIWETSNRTNYAVLPYKNVAGANGAPLPPPQRVPAGVDVSHLTLAAQRMQNHVRNVTGMADMFQEETAAQQANSSGRAILARRQAQELGSSDFMENLGDGICLTARIIMSMAREVYDTPRVMRITGDDDKERAIITHMGPEQQQAAQQMIQQDQQNAASLFDLQGSPEDYDVAISPGRRYDTDRQEAVDSISAAIQAYPPIAPVALPILFKNSDWKGAMELASALKPDGDEANAQQMQQQLQQAGQMIQMLQGELQKKTQIIETDQIKAQQQLSIEREKQQGAVTIRAAELKQEEQLAKMKIVADLLKTAATIEADQAGAMIDAAVSELDTHVAAAGQQADREHEATQNEQDRSVSMMDSEASRQHDAQMSERQFGHEADMGARQMGHEAGMARLTAKLTPKPKPGAKK